MYNNYDNIPKKSFLNNINTLSNKNYNKFNNPYLENKNNPHFFDQFGNNIASIAGVKPYNNLESVLPSQSKLLPRNNAYSYQQGIYNNNINEVYTKKKENDYFTNNYNKNIKENYSNKKEKDYYNNNCSNEKDRRDLNYIISSKTGLNNLGNTCYFNTCFQILMHSEDFIKRLIAKKSLISEISTPITYQFYSLCVELVNTKKPSIEPDNFIKILGKKHPELKKIIGISQFDTQELCRILLEDINNELNEVKFKGIYKELNTDGKSKLECCKEFENFSKSRESSIVIDTFYGQIINIFICKCKYENYSFQKMIDFPLLLPEDKDFTSINDLLNNYFSNEKIKFKCEGCYKNRTHKKEMKITQPPNILILSLQRINHRTETKNKCKVEFSEKLNIKDYIDKDSEHIDECNYNLFGIACHAGDFTFGHYFALIKLNDKDWYDFNDSKVKYYGDNIDKDSIFSYAYILFYKKHIQK